MSVCDQSGDATHNDRRPLSLSSEPHSRSGLCRQRRERSRSAWRSRAHRPSVEKKKMVAKSSHKNWADTGVPNPRGHHICMCKLYRLRPGPIPVARCLGRVGHTVVPRRNFPERSPVGCVPGGAIGRMFDGKSNASKQKRRHDLPLARPMPGWRQG